VTAADRGVAGREHDLIDGVEPQLGEIRQCRFGAVAEQQIRRGRLRRCKDEMAGDVHLRIAGEGMAQRFGGERLVEAFPKSVLPVAGLSLPLRRPCRPPRWNALPPPAHLHFAR
jgi:hypothetical protein